MLAIDRGQQVRLKNEYVALFDLQSFQASLLAMLLQQSQVGIWLSHELEQGQGNLISLNQSFICPRCFWFPLRQF